MIGSHFRTLVQRHGLSKQQVLYIGIQNKVFISQSMNRTCYWSGNQYTATWIVIPVLLCHWFCLGDVDSIADSTVIHYTVWVIDVFNCLKTDRLDGQAATVHKNERTLFWCEILMRGWRVSGCMQLAMCLHTPCRAWGPLPAHNQNVESLLASFMFSAYTCAVEKLRAQIAS